MVVVVVWLVDDQLMVSVHVYSPNIVYKMILNNENFDKINRLMLDKMHKVHFHVEMGQYQAKDDDMFDVSVLSNDTY